MTPDTTVPSADLVISAGRVIDPVTGSDAPGWVSVLDSRISAVGGAGGTPPPSGKRFDYPDGILLPGLVDLHAHPGLGDGRYGIDPDVHMLSRGSTTVLSQGDAGARNWDRYKAEVIGTRKTRIKMALHIGRNGEINPEGPFTELEFADTAECVATIQADDSGAIWGITVNTSIMTCGPSDPHEVLRRAVTAADVTDLPLLFGPRRAPGWALEDQLPLLRPGDVFTYCSDPAETTLVRDGHVRDCAREARERGILFDLGHGQIAINYVALEAMIVEDFLPDAISSDLYSFHLGLDQPHDLPLVMSKMRAVGMTEAQIWPRVTIRPAEILGMEDEIGTLNPGSCADISVLRWDEGPYVHADLEGDDRTGGIYLPVATVRAGEVFEPLA
jgi:dihydroorotase